MFPDLNITDRIKRTKGEEVLLKEIIDSDFPRLIEYYITKGVGYSNRRAISGILNPISLAEFRMYLADFDRSISYFQEQCRDLNIQDYSGI